MAQASRRRASNIENLARSLQLREAGLGRAVKFSKIPNRLQFPIDALVDRERALLGCIVLGFTRDGDFLVSYTSSPVAASEGRDGYFLQIWAFRPGERVRRAANIPLFRGEGTGTADDDDEGDLGGGGDPGLLFGESEDLIVTVCEAPDGSFMAVHGRVDRSSGGSGISSSSSLEDLELRNHLTVVAMPTAGYAELQVSHFSYHTLPPHPPFTPAVSLVPPSTLVLNLSTRVAALSFEVRLSCGRCSGQEARRTRRGGGGLVRVAELDPRGLREEDKPLEERGQATEDLGGDEGQWLIARAPGSPDPPRSPPRLMAPSDEGSRRLGPGSRAQLHWRPGGPWLELLDAEECIDRHLVRRLPKQQQDPGSSSSWRVADYSLQLVSVKPSDKGRNGASSSCFPSSSCCSSSTSTGCPCLSRIGQPHQPPAATDATAVVLIVAAVVSGLRKAEEGGAPREHAFVLVVAVDIRLHPSEGTAAAAAAEGSGCERGSGGNMIGHGNRRVEAPSGKGARGQRLLQRREVGLPEGYAKWTPALLGKAAEQQASALRRRSWALPPPPRAPTCLSNLSVVATEQSLAAIKHPLLPICLTGYSKGQKRGRT